MKRLRTGIRSKILLGFFAVVMINLIGEAVTYHQNEGLFELANELSEVEIQIRVETYASALRELSSGIFMIAAGREGMGQSAILEAELDLRELEAELAEVQWEHFGLREEEFVRCAAFKQSLLREAKTVLDLNAWLRGDGGVLTESQQVRARGRLDVSMSRAAMLTEHATLYISRITDVLRAHTQTMADRGRTLVGVVRVSTIATVAILTAVALIVSLVFAGSLSRRIVALERVTSAFGSGDMSARADIRGNDEIGVLANAFNRMADDIQANIDLRLSVAYVDNILNTMTNGLLVIGADGRIERVNRATCNLSGRSADELLDQDAGVLLPDAADDCPSPRTLVAQRRAVQGLEFELPTADGRTVPVSFSSALMASEEKSSQPLPNPNGDNDDEGPARRMVCIIDNIAERRRLFDELITARRRAEDAAHAKTVFLTTMSHELRTPLNGILGYVQILQQDDGLSDKQRHALEVMGRSGQHLLTLLGDILDLSKIEADRIELHPSEFHLPNFLRDIADIFRIQAEAKGIQFYFDSVSQLPAAVRGDGKRIRQVLLNLLGNAVKFTDQGGVLFKIDIEGDTFRFQIKDTGPGIEADQLEKIFEPFAQAEAGSKRHEGTGLGLAISRRLVDMMGGSLTVTSNVGQGSKFVLQLSLPAIGEQKLPVAKDPPAVEGDEIAAEKPRPCTVLIADDRPRSRAHWAGLLSRANFRIVETINFRDTVKRAQLERPDAMVIHVGMQATDGAADGISLGTTVRDIPALSRLVIIGVSARGAHSLPNQAIVAGCDEVLTEPVSLEALTTAITTRLAVPHVDDSVSGSAAIRVNALELPSEAELLPLAELALRGDIKGIKQEIERIEELDVRFGPFVSELRQLAQGYRIKQIRELLRSHRGLC